MANTLRQRQGKIEDIYFKLPKVKTGVNKLQVCLFSATLHSKEVKGLVSKICDKPTWVDLKGVESVPDTVHHCVVRVNKDYLSLIGDGSSSGNKIMPFVKTDAVHRKDAKLEEAVEWDSMNEDDKNSERLKMLKVSKTTQASERSDDNNCSERSDNCRSATGQQ